MWVFHVSVCVYVLLQPGQRAIRPCLRQRSSCHHVVLLKHVSTCAANVNTHHTPSFGVPRRGDVDAAVTFAQQHLAPYRDPTLLQRHVCHPQLSIKEAQAFLEEVVALIAYPDPATCACGWILGQPQRERVADIANRAVLDALVRGGIGWLVARTVLCV